MHCHAVFKIGPLEKSKLLAILIKMKQERRRKLMMQRAILSTIGQRRRFLLKISRLLSESLITLIESEPVPHPKSIRCLKRNVGWWEAAWSTYSEERFERAFHVTRGTFQHIVGKLYNFLMNGTVNEEPISPERRLAICLYRLGRGDYMYTIAELAGIGKSTPCGIVVEVCQLIVEIVWEETASTLLLDIEEKMMDLMKCMDAEWQFTYAYAAMNCSHMPIRCPSGGAEVAKEHYTFKNFYSIVLMAIVDLKFSFL